MTFPKSYYTTLLAMALSSSSFAENFLATVSIGPAWESAGKSQTFFLAPGIEKTYAAQRSTHSLADGELFLGLQKTISNTFKAQMGVAFTASNNATLSGTIWDDADPTFNNYSYRYQVRHTHVAMKAKLLADYCYKVIPWVSMSIGAGFNQAHHFSNTPLISEAIAAPNFSNKTVTAFTYTLGIGAQTALNRHWQAGIGYEFADWGASQLGKASGQTLHRGLSLSHLYTNGLLFSLTYA